MRRLFAGTERSGFALLAASVVAAARFGQVYWRVARVSPVPRPDFSRPPPGDVGPGYGWWSWWDQHRYLDAALAWAHGVVDPAWHWYLPGYPLLGAAFLRVAPGQPFLIPDLLCVLGALWCWFRPCCRWAGCRRCPEHCRICVRAGSMRIWTGEGRVAGLRFALPVIPRGDDAVLELDARGYVPRRRERTHLRVVVNDHVVARWAVGGSGTQLRAVLPAGGGAVTVWFEIVNPRRPADYDGTVDGRALGLYVKSFEVTAVPH